MYCFRLKVFPRTSANYQNLLKITRLVQIHRYCIVDFLNGLKFGVFSAERYENYFDGICFFADIDFPNISFSTWFLKLCNSSKLFKIKNEKKIILIPFPQTDQVGN